MLATIVRASLERPRIVTALSLLIALLGVATLLNARLDVFPDFAPPHVLVQVESPGLDATQVEALITRPIEELLAGAENVAAVRSTSSQGLAAIRVVFGRESDPYVQRQVISERLAEASTLLPAGVGPARLSPLSSSMEYLLHFGFTSERLSPTELRDLIRWTIRPQILAVPGVAQAQIFGGDSRERQVWVDPVRLNAAGVTLEEVGDAARNSSRLPIRSPRSHRRWSPSTTGRRCASATSPRCATVPRRVSAMPSSAATRAYWWRLRRSSVPTRSM
jgi:Cu/Ag efflux pump CusA